jgi:hypothetical protein
MRRRLLGALLLLTVASAAAAAPPPFRKVFIVVLENTAYTDALAQPFLSELAGGGAVLTNFFAEAHPSFPNYVALTAGSSYGLTSDATVTLDVPHVGDLLEASGGTWKAYAEGYPGNCFLGASAGAYVRRHVPFLSFANVQADPARCARVVNASALADDVANGALADYSLYIPDLNNDGHDTGVAFADQWLARTFALWLADPSFTHRMLFVVTFDESAGAGPNHIYTALFGPGVVPGSTSSAPYDHYSLLRTIEDALSLGTLGQHDVVASPITGVWQHASFDDVLPGDAFWSWIEALVAAGITGGCGTNPAAYCPDQAVRRAEMAVFLVRGVNGPGYQPPAATGTMFTDVPEDYPFAPWIEQLAREGISGGCATSPPAYCPEDTVTRAQMAVFLLRATHGAAYQPPPTTGVTFSDVPTANLFAPWIEQLAREGITGGCGGGNYCPDDPVTRGQMAVFLVRAFNLPI